MSKPSGRVQASLRAAQRLMLTHALLASALERGLKRAGLPSLAQHDVLGLLAGADGLRLRPVEIGSALVMAQYNLSRLIDRMIAAQLVQRVAVEGDARGQWVVMTLEGAVIQRQMADLVASTAAAHFEERLDETRLRKLSKLLRRMAPKPAGAANAAV